MVDSDRAACEAIRKNIQAVKCAEKCRLIPRDYHQAMDELSKTGCRFNLVFLDPPYRMTETGEICEILALRDLLTKDSLLVVEHRRSCLPKLSDKFTLEQTRKYGDTEISFVRYAGSREAQE